MDTHWTTARRAEVLALLTKYGRHLDRCPQSWPQTVVPWSFERPPCSCGLDAARAELARGGTP